MVKFNEKANHEIVKLLWKNSGRKLRLRDISSLLGLSYSHTWVCLARLEKAGVARSEKVKQKRYVYLNGRSGAAKKALEKLGIVERKGADIRRLSESELYHYKGTVERVVDGDTLDIRVDLGFYLTANLRFRLAGINTPEIHGVRKDSAAYKKGMRAKRVVTELVAGREVLFSSKRTGMYGRWLAYVWVDGVSVNDLLVERGLAKKY